MMKQLSRWQHSKGQKRNNRGSSLLLVVATMAIVGILVVVLMSLSLLNLRMKVVNLNSQKNFYDAESALDEIKQGLAVDVSNATGTAYVNAIENYSKTDATQRKTLYIQSFDTQILLLIKDHSRVDVASHYSLDHLKGLVSNQLTSSGTIRITSSDGNQVLNVDAATGTYTLKNLVVTYTDNKDYMTQIKTDIVLSCPELEFNQQQSLPELMTYSLIANDTTYVSGGNIQVNGNAYLGKNGADLQTGTVTFTKKESIGRLVTGGQMHISQGANVTINDGYETWARDLYVDSATATVNGTTYLNDDVTLENSGKTSVKAALSGELYAYGDGSGSSPVFQQETTYQDELEKNPANFSSAVLINGIDATLDLSGLKKMMLSGTAYVATTQKGSDNDAMMGESISLKSNQRAYLLPAKYLAAFCENGRVNPMTEDKYNALVQELTEKLGYNDSSKLSDMDFLRTKSTENGTVPSALSSYGVTGIQKAVYRVTIDNDTTISMVYFFLKFDQASSAEKYREYYYHNSSKLENLQHRVDSNHYNTRIHYPSNLLDATPTSFDFYYNGSVLVPDSANTRFLTGKCTTISSSSQSTLAKMQTDFQNQFAALRHKLLDNYGALTTSEKNQDIYQNLVTSMTNADATRNIGKGDSKLFTAPDNSISALVVNRDCTISEENSNIHVIIANGDITVDSDFKGLLIAAGNVTFAKSNINVEADKNLVLNCLKLENEYGVTAADYLINGSYYFGNATSGGEVGKGTIDFENCVTYQNWVKQ